MNDLVSLLLSPSDFAGLHGRCRTTRAAIEELIVEAAKSILVTAYTFDDPRISTLLATRAEEGVRVEVYLDKDQFLNDKYSRVARQSVHDRLIDAGARVHLLDTQPDATFHVKALIADNRKAVIGSANITTRGLDRNTEIGLLLEGPTVAHLATAVKLNLRQIQNERGCSMRLARLDGEPFPLFLEQDGEVDCRIKWPLDVQRRPPTGHGGGCCRGQSLFETSCLRCQDGT